MGMLNKEYRIEVWKGERFHYHNLGFPKRSEAKHFLELILKDSTFDRNGIFQLYVPYLDIHVRSKQLRDIMEYRIKKGDSLLSTPFTDMARAIRGVVSKGKPVLRGKSVPQTITPTKRKRRRL